MARVTLGSAGRPGRRVHRARIQHPSAIASFFRAGSETRAPNTAKRRASSASSSAQYVRPMISAAKRLAASPGGKAAQAAW